ncbi:MAG: hypothetical protein R3E79_24345 [Caldilineaceae bacterium]
MRHISESARREFTGREWSYEIDRWLADGEADLLYHYGEPGWGRRRWRRG